MRLDVAGEEALEDRRRRVADVRMVIGQEGRIGWFRKRDVIILRGSKRRL